MLKFLKQLLKFVKEWFLWLGAVFLGSVCLVITGIIGEARFGWAVFPGSEGHVPILKFILLLLVVMFVVVIVVVGPFAVLKAIWSARKARKLYIERLEDIIDMAYTIVYCTPDEYIKDSLEDLFRSQGVGQNNQQDPSSQNKVFFRPVIDILQDCPDGDTSDPTSREPSSDTKPDS
ncbi:TPA: hypothetical protein DIT45_01475 [Candidatus Acetothermia bacterium]|nr:hypothetical protein [Candidatus Acetothermia bacterium]